MTFLNIALPSLAALAAFALAAHRSPQPKPIRVRARKR
ncbi:hypothetical protein QO016_004911 [Methylobacterium persicinum]|uniref:Uncharacterized protein n=1 Tax=Methylobacterium persicinum TaxID=374426 RepID=A0ABU0HSS9_9HYPH|nr:hypothetical protein [Methylobacterium persicinum]GJE40548.1 hypothetical protein KHHGKMAE_4643 [Methylobacterium persicinum]